MRPGPRSLHAVTPLLVGHSRASDGSDPARRRLEGQRRKGFPLLSPLHALPSASPCRARPFPRRLQSTMWPGPAPTGQRGELKPRKGDPFLMGAIGLALRGKPRTQRVSAEIASLLACAPRASLPRYPVSGPAPRPSLGPTCTGSSDQARPLKQMPRHTSCGSCSSTVPQPARPEPVSGLTGFPRPGPKSANFSGQKCPAHDAVGAEAVPSCCQSR